MLNRYSFIWILLAIALAVVAGLWQEPHILKLAQVVSEIFVRLLKLISLPIISLSLLATISSVGESSLSSMGKRIVSYTIITTTIAATLGLLLYQLIKPVSVVASTVSATAPVMGSYLDAVLKLIPNNLLQPFLEGNVVSILILSLLLGFGIASLPAQQRLPLHQLLQSLFQIMMQITRWIVSFMPIAVWGFITTFIVELAQGLSIVQISWYLFTVVSANIIHALIILPLFLLVNKISPLQTFKKMLPALSFAFFTKSSAAAMPTAIDCAERGLGVSSKVARFSFPLCTTINMNACALFIITTVLFVAESNGVSITMSEKCLWIVIATIAAIGNAGVPMGCFFIASALLSTMNVPLTLMGIILPFYALLDMLESATNIWSDACVTMAVDKSEQAVAVTS